MEITSMRIPKSLMDRALKARKPTAEEEAAEDKETEELAAELGVDLPEVIRDTDSEEEKARKLAKNAAITARNMLGR